MKDGTAKDELRIQSLITKSAGDSEKELKYAKNMANAINKPDKAYGRASAAVSVLGTDHPVTKIFLDRAEELGYMVNIDDAINQQAVDIGFIEQADVLEDNTIYLPTASAIAIWKYVVKDIIRRKRNLDMYGKNYRAYENRPSEHWLHLNVAVGSPQTVSSNISQTSSTHRYRYDDSRTRPNNDNRVLRGIQPEYTNKLIKVGTFGRAVGEDVLTTNYNANGNFYATYGEKDLQKDLKFIKQAMANIKKL